MNMVLINVSVAPLLAKPEKKAELADEVLYGTRCEVVGEEADGFKKIRTEYGYEGYVETGFLVEDRFGANHQTNRFVVTSTFADVLPEPNIRRRALVHLPRGGFVLNAERGDDGWSRATLADGGYGYVRTNQLMRWVHHENVGSLNEFSLRQNVIETAFNYFNFPYRWGGRTPQGIDCSGLAFMVYMLNGVFIYRDASIELSMKKGFPVKKIEYRQAQMGDLLYFPGHIAVYLGNGRFIHSSHSNDGVSVNSLNELDDDYRADLKETLICAGSVFA